MKADILRTMGFIWYFKGIYLFEKVGISETMRKEGIESIVK